MGRRYDTVSLLTDYGLVDEFVGVVKAVIHDIAPHARTIDLTHNISPFDVRAGSLTLARCVSYLPSGVILGVVDPGVGGTRKSIAIEVADGEGVFVGPDNGLLAPAVAMAGGAQRAVVLTNEEYHLPSHGATFAGRDIFAPVVGHLCNGVDLAELGDLIDAEALLPGMVPLSRIEPEGLVGEVLWVDHFGNCQLNIGPDEIDGWGTQVQVSFGESVRVATRQHTFGDVSTGAVGLVVDSCGMLALVLDRRSAADELGLGAGDQVTLVQLTEGAPNAQDGVTSPVSMRAR
ncbi:MAG TPA: SAM-dependent chlorinase/fluorinase [Ilumatobacteraceae bacterium]|nr:SAM-dependent chlorinase/fluorinase [Ilumatobacteraceae bacterium]